MRTSTRRRRRATLWSTLSPHVGGTFSSVRISTHLGVVSHVPSWFPGTEWMQTRDRMRASLNDVLTKPINFVKEQLVCVPFLCPAYMLTNTRIGCGHRKAIVCRVRAPAARPGRRGGKVAVSVDRRGSLHRRR
jgi:hypothetical protein